MNEIALSYGQGSLKAEIPVGWQVRVVTPAFWPEIDLEQELTEGLRSPIGCQPLSDLARNARKVAIVTSDQTRPLPSDIILPVVVDELLQAGVPRDAIKVVIGVGNHRGTSEAEKKKLLGPVYGKVQCIHSKETGYILLGMTKRGTPVEVAVPVAQADLVVALGNIEYHQLAGFTGGVKAVAAGTASRQALEHNHRLSALGAGGLGELDQNIVRRDMEEFAFMANLSFIINVVLNEHGRAIAVVAGDPVQAHRVGCQAAQRIYGVEIAEPADIVIVSPGGEPKDSTVYQAQKTVRNALRAVRDGGIIIVAAKCREGFGDPVFEQWMNNAGTPGQLLARSSREFVLGGHKGAFIAQAVDKARIFWVSDLPPEQVKTLFFEPFDSLQGAVDQACSSMGGSNAAGQNTAGQGAIVVLPWGGVTVPYIGKLQGGKMDLETLSGHRLRQ